MNMVDAVDKALTDALGDISSDVLEALNKETSTVIYLLQNSDDNKSAEAMSGNWQGRLSAAYKKRTNGQVYKEGDTYVTNYGLDADDEAVQTIYKVITAGNYEGGHRPYTKPGELTWNNNIDGKNLSNATSVHEVHPSWGHYPSQEGKALADNALKQALGSAPDYSRAREIIANALRKVIGQVKWA